MDFAPSPAMTPLDELFKRYGQQPPAPVATPEQPARAADLIAAEAAQKKATQDYQAGLQAAGKVKDTGWDNVRSVLGALLSGSRTHVGGAIGAGLEAVPTATQTAQAKLRPLEEQMRLAGEQLKTTGEVAKIKTGMGREEAYSKYLEQRPSEESKKAEGLQNRFNRRETAGKEKLAATVQLRQHQLEQQRLDKDVALATKEAERTRNNYDAFNLAKQSNPKTDPDGSQMKLYANAARDAKLKLDKVLAAADAHAAKWEKGGGAKAEAAAAQPLDRDTAQQFLDQAGGDPEAARQAARDAGYEF